MVEVAPARRRRWAALGASAVGALLIAFAGCILLEASLARDDGGVRFRPQFGWLLSPVADALARLSYDLLFVVRGDVDVPPATIVYLDEGSARALGQTPDAWDRRLHAALVRKLRADGARAVLFDIVFAGPSADPAADEDFAAAIREHGHVILGAALELEEGVGSQTGGPRVSQARVIPPTQILRRAAAGWGLLVFRPVDADYGVRRIYAGTETIPSAAWVLARSLGAPLPLAFEERARLRWLNYYGRADLLPSIGFDRALAADGPREVFRDQIVIIGGRSTLGALRLGKDEFRSPYGWLGGRFLKGPEIHATAAMNLLRGEWLTRMPPMVEFCLVLGFGLLLGAGLPGLRPHAAAGVALLAAAAVAVAAFWIFSQQRIWGAWAIPVVVQAPLALLWAVGTRYFIEERRRRALREAFAHYLSPQMADRIADADFDLALGGTVVEATIMFTDLENFMGLAEELDEPDRVAKVLTTYFTQTTGHILESDGTILKYLGDSVQAVWGAPLPDSRQAFKAVRAALRLHEAGRMEVLGHPLRTRIGLNTGRVLAGNLGSAQRFDYATTGDAVNFASRLESLNKYLGTSILISDSVVAQLDDSFLLRCVGAFRVVGKKTARVIYEVLGEGLPEPTWLPLFRNALDAFQNGDLDAAETGFGAAAASREGGDRASQFYLERIAMARTAPSVENWTGVVELSAK